MQSLIQLYMLLAIFCLLLFKSFHEIFVNYYLKTLLLLLLFITVVKMLTESGIINPAPFLYLSANTALFLFMPGVYLYLRSQVDKQRMSIKDLPHLVPALGYGISCVLVYVMKNGLALPGADIFNESPGTQGAPFLYFLLFGYAVTGWYLVLVLKILKDKYELPRRNEVLASAALYGDRQQLEHPHPVEVHTNTTYLNDEKIAKMDHMIKTFLCDKQPFLQHGYSLKQLAEDTHLPLHLLSAFINKYYKVNFNDFINEYRVNYCKVKILNDEWKYKKLEAIAEESGFSNRNTFTAAFKRVTGLNPSEFLKVIKEQQAA
jgi:AraC-like DNA-binding protein